MKFLKNPEVVEAVQWTGENAKEMMGFLGSSQLLYEGNALCVGQAGMYARVMACPGDWVLKNDNELFVLRPSELLKAFKCFDFEFNGQCGCCGFEGVPVKLMPEEKAYVCNVCLVEKTPQQREAVYHKNLGVKP